MGPSESPDQCLTFRGILRSLALTATWGDPWYKTTAPGLVHQCLWNIADGQGSKAHSLGRLEGFRLMLLLPGMLPVHRALDCALTLASDAVLGCADLGEAGVERLRGAQIALLAAADHATPLGVQGDALRKRLLQESEAFRRAQVSMSATRSHA